MNGFAIRIRAFLAIVTLAILFVYWLNADYFGYEIIAEIAVFAILAMSLDLMAGYTGMVSLGHGALLGFGAYMFAAFTLKLGMPTAVAMVAAVGATAVLSLLVALLVVRAHGIFFIMITLAIGEMGYEYFFHNRALGGDDGLAGLPRLDLSAIGVNLTDPGQFALALILMVAVVYLLLLAILRSPYGLVLVGIHENPQRMRALGYSVNAYKVSAFVLSGAVAGFAGTLSAQHTQFITPQLLHWTTSGETLIMVILGGLGTLVGPIVGAATVTLLRHELSNFTDYWALWLGLFLIIVVVSGRNGIIGAIEDVLRMAFRRPRAQEAADAES